MKKSWRLKLVKSLGKQIHRPWLRSVRYDLVSHHIFMLPFKWSPNDRDGFISQKEFDAVIQDYLAMPGWTSHSFSLERIVDYNEFHYFYDYVREALYDYGERDKDFGFIRHLEFEAAKGGKYLIETPIPKAQRAEKYKYNDGGETVALRKIYELEIDSVLLHLYYTGVGVLSFHLNNRRKDQAAPEDILYINQYGRRVFPPFYRIPNEKVGFDTAFEDADFIGTGRPHGSEVAYSVGIRLPNELTIRREDWSMTPVKMLDPKRKLTFKLAGFISPFLGLLDQKYRIQSVLDDRMFIVCWYGNERITKELTPRMVVKRQDYGEEEGNVLRAATEEDHRQALLQHDWWYKFAFVDAEDVTVQHSGMRREVLQKASYLRWANYGTFYGVTDYSFVLLTDELLDLRKPWVNATFLVTHLQTIYFRLCELVLVQRACVQRFSDEVTHVSRLEVPEQDSPNFSRDVDLLAREANELYQRYIRFVNRVYFREVTAQVQGIELYEKLHQQARLPAMVKGLKEEIHELHNYVRQETDRQLVAVEKKRWEILNLLGAVLIVPGIIIAAFDLNFFAPCFREADVVHPFVYMLFVAALAGYLTHNLFTNFSKAMAWQVVLILVFLMIFPWTLCVFTIL
jgi:hypothetical protein